MQPRRGAALDRTWSSGGRGSRRRTAYDFVAPAVRRRVGEEEWTSERRLGGRFGTCLGRGWDRSGAHWRCVAHFQCSRLFSSFSCVSFFGGRATLCWSAIDSRISTTRRRRPNARGSSRSVSRAAVCRCATTVRPTTMTHGRAGSCAASLVRCDCAQRRWPSGAAGWPRLPPCGSVPPPWPPRLTA